MDSLLILKSLSQMLVYHLFKEFASRQRSLKVKIKKVEIAFSVNLYFLIIKSIALASFSSCCLGSATGSSMT